MNQKTENRREFLKKASLAAVSIPLLLNCKNNTLAQKSDEDILSLIKKNALQAEGAGQWNGAKDAPNDVSWRTDLSKNEEKGEKILISGTVYQSDGKKLAPNVLIYFYHTDIEGYYGRKGVDKHPHGRFRGWMLTDANGRYEFQTIKPAPYPQRKYAAHIHFTLTTAKMREDWIDSILFEGDRLISAQERRDAGKKGGFSPILKLEKNENGIWTATRNIQLWKV